MGPLVVVQCQTDLLEIVSTLHASSRLPGSLDGREQKPDKDSDDGDDYQEFHKGKTALAALVRLRVAKHSWYSNKLVLGHGENS